MAVDSTVAETTVRVQVVSDLHLEFLSSFPNWSGIFAHPDADFLVLAGDIGTIENVVQHFAYWPVPCVWVLGNHEFYGEEFAAVRERARQLTCNTSVVLLDNNVLLADDLSLRRFDAWFTPRRNRLRGLRILGATLWTDYMFIDGNPERSTQARRMEEVGRRLNDHRLIRVGARRFGPADALAEHQASRRWLKSELARPFSGRTLVVTHHGPDRRSVHPRYVGDVLNCAFVSELPDLLGKADVWLHGHVHDSFSYWVEACQVIANPRGYPLNRNNRERPEDLVFENSGFDPALLVEV